MPEIKNYIVRVKSQAVLDTVITDVMSLGVKIEHVYKRVFYGFSAPLTGLYVKTLSKDSRIDIIEEAAMIGAYARQDEAPWHLDRIDQRVLPLSGSYTYSSDGTNVIAYVLDSGCVYFNNDKAHSDTANFNHVDFGGRINPVNELDTFGNRKPNVVFDPIYNRLQILDPENSRLSSPRGFDHYGHGTHVAGIIGSATYGVAKNVDIRPAKVLDVFGGGLTSDVVAGIEAILADFEQNNTSVLPAVCNMSIGTAAPAGAVPTGSFEEAVQALVDAGITVVVAAGNEGQDANNISPARMESVITVGATGRTVDSEGIVTGDVIASFSNFGDGEDVDADENFGFTDSVATNTGSALDMFAPGVGIVSTYNSSPTATNTFSGTSMASPCVAGAAILVLQNNPTLSPSGVQSLLISNSIENIISGVPAGTPNRMLFSTFVDHEIQWLTPAGDLGSFSEGYTLNPRVDLDAVGFSGQQITYSNPTGGLPAGIAVNALTGVLEGTAPSVTSDIVYNFDIKASDGSGFVNRSFSLTILDGDLPPTWITAPNLSSIEEGDVLNTRLLARSQSIPETILTYEVVDNIGNPTSLPYGWQLSTSGVLTGDVLLVVNDAFDVLFIVRAQDGATFSDRTFTITISQSSFIEPPVWQTASDLGDIIRFQPVSIPVLATDADGQPRPVTYHSTFTAGDGTIFGASNTLPQGLLLNENTGEITGVFNGLMTDGITSDTTTFDNNTTTFDNNLTTTETDEAIFEFQIFAVDGAHVVGRTFSLVIHNLPDNEPVVWETPSASLGEIKALTFGSFTVLANDPDAGPRPLKYTLVSGELPINMFLDTNTGIISGVPANVNEQEKISIFGIAASDGLSVVTRTFSITVKRANRQPEWITPVGALIPPINEGENFSFQLEAIDPNTNDVLRYRVITVEEKPVTLDNGATTFDGDTTTITDFIDIDSVLPDGLTLDTSTGIISGRIDSVDEDTTFEFTVRVDDSPSNTEDILFSDRTFSITVVDGALNINEAPVWSTPIGALPDGLENQHYRYELLATDFDGPDALKFILVAGALPQGLTLNTNSGVISGFPTDADTTDTTSFFTVRAFDGVKSTDRTFNIKIIDATVGNLPPVWITDSGNIGSFDELTSVVVAVQAIDPEGDNVTYIDAANSLPTGLVITINGIINGVAPQVSSNQDFNFTIDARDEHGGITQRDFTITVNDIPNIPPVWITDPTLGSFPEGAFTPIVLSAIDPDTGPLTNLTYTDTSGSATHLLNVPFGATVGLPPGLSLSSSGIISGFSTVTGDTVFSFEATVSDGAANISRQFIITITEAALIPSDRSSLSVRLSGGHRNEFKNWNTSDLIFDEELFAAEIPEFGRNTEPDIYMFNNIHTLNPTDITTVFGVHHNSFNALAGVPASAVVRDINGNIVYEVVYVNVIDPQAGSSEDIINDYQTRDDPLTLPDETISYNFDHLRTELQTLPNSEQLPDWMSSEQILGDSSSVIGYMPAIVLAYVKPGFGEVVIDRINEIEATNVITPASETTFDDTVVFGSEFNPIVSPGDVLTIKNGPTAASVPVVFTAPGTLLQVAQDINDAFISGVTAAVRKIEQFIPDNPATTYPGTFQTGQVLAITYNERTIEFGGSALNALGLPTVGRETIWNDGTTFDNATGTELTITKGPGYQFTGRKLFIDRYLFDDNITDVTSITTFDGGTTTLDGDTTTFDRVTGTQKWIKFRSDIDNPVWLTTKGILGGFSTGDSISIQLEATNNSGATILYSLIYGVLPDGITIDNAGLISGTTTGSAMMSNYFVIRAMDTTGKYTDRGFEIIIDGPTTFDNDLTTFDGDTTTLDVV